LLPARLQASYEAAMSDPDLLSVRRDVAVLQAAIEDRWTQIQEAQSQPDWGDVFERFETFTANMKTWEWTRIEREAREISEMMTNRQSESQAFYEIRDIMNQRARFAKQEQDRLIELGQYMTSEQAIVFVSAVASMIRKYVPDKEEQRRFNDELMGMLRIPDRRALAGV